MSYNSKCYVRVTNNFSNSANITLQHSYGGDTPQKGSWNGILAGQDTPYMEVDFNLGFIRTGTDTWQVTCDVQNSGIWVSDSHDCMLRSADADHYLTFSVSTDAFVMTEISGTCSTGWAQRP